MIRYQRFQEIDQNQSAVSLNMYMDTIPMQYLFHIFEMGINIKRVHSEWCSSHIAIQCAVAVMQNPCIIFFDTLHYISKCLRSRLLIKAFRYLKMHILLTQMCECTPVLLLDLWSWT